MAITTFKLMLVFLSCAILYASSSAQNCSTFTFLNHKVFNSCTILPSLSSSVHWNYFPSTGRVDMAYRANQSSTGWIAWAINPTAIGMVGSQALVAFQQSNGSMIAYPTAITSYQPLMKPSNLSFPVYDIGVEYGENVMSIFATLELLNNSTSVNIAWQAGSSVSGNVPNMHPISGANIQSFGTLDFLSG